MSNNKKSNKLKNLIFLVAVFMGAFQLYTSLFRSMAPIKLQNIHLLFAYLLTFLYALDKTIDKNRCKSVKLLAIAMIVLSVVGTLYIHFNFDDLVSRVGKPIMWDLIVGLILILVTIEATRINFGIAIPILTVTSILYMFVGPYLPGILYHGGFSLKRVIAFLTVNLGGMYGTLLNVSATFVALFMIFGGILGASGGSKFFMDLAMAIGGKFRAGPALAAVISSALMGSINGSAVANVATTGVFTIPMMKDRGYKPYFAAAVEAVASTGGMYLPPVMGVGAFVMSEITGIPYIKIAAAALIPALLYYLLIAVTIVLRSQKMDIQLMDESSIPSLKGTLKEGFYYLIPIAAIVYCMAVGFSVTKAALHGIGLLTIIYVLKIAFSDAKLLLQWKGWKPMFEGIVDGINSTIGVAATMACVGLMVYCIVSSGLANRLVGVVLSVGKDQPFFSLLITMLITLFFGMGIPTTASYIILSIMAAPALVDAGFPLLSVHMFIYYFTIIGNITPPVGSAAIVASRLANADYNKTCWYSIKLAFSAFVLPFIFVFRPELMGQGETGAILNVVVTATIGMVIFAMFSEGFALVKTNLLQRVLLLIASILLILPLDMVASLIGIVLVIIILMTQYREYKSVK